LSSGRGICLIIYTSLTIHNRDIFLCLQHTLKRTIFGSMTQEVLHQQLSEQGGDSASKQYDSRGWLDQLRDDVAVRWTDLPVLACCAVSGLCDSVAFNATGTFASMQTGMSYPKPLP